MSISPSTVDDIPQLVPLINNSFTNDDGAGSGWTKSSHVVSGPRIDPQDPNPKDLIADNITATILKYQEENKDILGCVRLDLKTNSDNTKRVCHLGLLCVSPKAQGKGIGKKVMVASENWAKSNSVYVMEISVVNAREDLIQFYERHGYVRTGETEPYPVNPGIRVPRIEGLYMVLLEKPLTE